MHRRRGRVLLLLGLLTLACNLPGRTPTPTPAPTTTPTVVATEVGAATVTSEATATSEGCTLDAEFVVDVTIPDDTEVAPGEAFRKTWRVRNSGTCPWEPGTQLVYTAEDPLGGPPSVTVPPTTVGTMVDLSVDFEAPAAPGTYRSVWRLQSPAGELFGDKVYVQVVVPGAATSTPAATDTPEPTSTSKPSGATATPTDTPTLPPACAAPDAQFAALVAQAAGLGIDVSCAVASPSNIGGAFQEYWANVDDVNPHTHFRSLMIWRADNKKIYVVRGQDTNAYRATVSVHADTWDESQPEVATACSTMEAPAGYRVPVRGFGKLWCNASLWTTVGWPAEPETAVTLTVQPTDDGLLMKVSGPPITYLVAMDFESGEATVLME